MTLFILSYLLCWSTLEYFNVIMGLAVFVSTYLHPYR